MVKTAAIATAAIVGCRISAKVVQKVFGGDQSGIREALRPLEEGARKEAAAFVSKHRRAIAGAVQGAEGMWIVREPGQNEFIVMRERAFAEFERKVADEGGLLCKVTIEGDVAVLSRYEGGVLEGTTMGEPAVLRLGANGSRNVEFYDRGIRIAQATDSKAALRALLPDEAGMPFPAR